MPRSQLDILHSGSHGIPFEMMDKLLRLGHNFFELPQETKDRIQIFKSMDRVRGYQRIGENVTYGKRDQQEVSWCSKPKLLETDIERLDPGNRYLP
jgi:isopenicillin N synthase-like dioxygenase